MNPIFSLLFPILSNGIGTMFGDQAESPNGLAGLAACCIAEECIENFPIDVCLATGGEPQPQGATCADVDCLNGIKAYRVECWNNPDYYDPWPICPEQAFDEVFTKVAIGDGFSLGLRPDGSIMHWGDCQQNECYIPAGTFTDIFAGVAQAYARDGNGRLHTIGDFYNSAQTLQDVDADFIKVEFGNRDYLDGTGNYNWVSATHAALTSDGELWLGALFPPEFSSCSDTYEPVLIASNVDDFAIAGVDSNYSSEQGESGVYYRSGSDWFKFDFCTGQISEYQESNPFNADITNVESCKLYSSLENIFLLEDDGDLLASNFRHSLAIPSNIKFRSFSSNAWSNLCGGVSTTGQVVTFSENFYPYRPASRCSYYPIQNWGAPDVAPSKILVSQCHALALIDSLVPSTFCATDITQDGVVDFQDLIELISAWGPCTG